MAFSMGAVLCAFHVSNFAFDQPPLPRRKEQDWKSAGKSNNHLATLVIGYTEVLLSLLPNHSQLEWRAGWFYVVNQISKENLQYCGCQKIMKSSPFERAANTTLINPSYPRAE